ncbi:MAG: hypothetical protein Q7O66_08090 [Dehalococcoidia bacterium]|nr:hypothetical protein [Dehalococcoidia bacterium]
MVGTVEPTGVTTITLPSNWGQIVLPSGLVTTTTTFTYTQNNSPPDSTGGFSFAGRSFSLVSTDLFGNPITHFSTTFTITLEYEDSDWQGTGVTDESKLNLYFWNGSSWAGVLPCAGCSLDIDSNRLVAVLDHLTQFALLAPAQYRVFLPLTLRGYGGGW